MRKTEQYRQTLSERHSLEVEIAGTERAHVNRLPCGLRVGTPSDGGPISDPLNDIWYHIYSTIENLRHDPQCEGSHAPVRRAQLLDAMPRGCPVMGRDGGVV